MTPSVTGSASAAPSVRKKSGNRISELDGLRGIAILLVLVFHFTPRSGPLSFMAHIFQLGWTGVDFLSYSSWWSIGWDADASKVYKDFAYVAGLLHGAAAERKLTTRLIIGEFGEYWNVHPDGARLKALVDASIDNGIEYLFNWVLYDQPGNKDEWGRDASHFGKYRLDRMLTPQGEAFRHWFQSQ